MFNTQEKKERALGVKLFLKASRCASPKCATVRRPTRPGMHGAARRRAPSEYGRQLLEKQKFQFAYGLREAQVRSLFKKALKDPAATGMTFANLLEARLDNVLYRLGFTASRSVARQVVGHGHIFVKGRRVSISSYSVRVGDVISLRPQSKDHPVFKEITERLKNYEPPAWLKLNKDAVSGSVVSAPRVDEPPFDVGLVVDYYSKIVK